MNFQRSDIRSQRSELNAVKGRGPNGALRPQPSVQLHIEELVLHGFAPGDRYAISGAVQCELARLLGEEGVPISLRSETAIDEIGGATFNPTPNEKPHAIGRRIAQAVYQGFSRAVAGGGDPGSNRQIVLAGYQGLNQ
jgi:hypothetical protein